MTGQKSDSGLKNDFERFFALVRLHHEGQMRAGNTPQWQHCRAVAEHLERALSLEGKIDEQVKKAMILSALGHDLYEDTRVSGKEIVATCGPDVHNIIASLTNRKGDSDVGQYVRQVSGASEEARLIKLADLYDNYYSVGENCEELGWGWIERVFLPIVEPMYDRLKRTKFSKYRQAGTHLLQQVQEVRKRCIL